MTLRIFMQNLMQSRTKVWIVALLMAPVPMLTWLSLVLGALVTLSKGAKEGALLMLAITACSLVPVIIGGHTLLVFTTYTANMLLWFVAVVLRTTNAWTPVIRTAIFAGSVLVIAVHAAVPEIQVWWLTQLQHMLQALPQKPQMDVVLLQQNVALFAKIATGLQVAFMQLDILWKLMLARWLQAVWHERKVLGQELAQMRLDKVSALGLLLCAGGALLQWAPLLDALPALTLPCILVGISLAHSLFLRSRLATVMFYVLLVVFFLQVGLVLTVMALTDTWLDLRARKNSAA